MEVPLCDIVLSSGKPIKTSSQKYPLALTARLRLNYERFGFASIELLLERLEILG